MEAGKQLKMATKNIEPSYWLGSKAGKKIPYQGW